MPSSNHPENLYDRADYSGPFDPDFRYEDLSKEALVRLVREYAMIVHLLDRSMCAAIGIKYGQEVVEELAIEEWRGASPIYNERLRAALGIQGDGLGVNLISSFRCGLRSALLQLVCLSGDATALRAQLFEDRVDLVASFAWGEPVNGCALRVHQGVNQR